MKKIMFNDKYGLTEAVLSGRKTHTRRVIPNCTGVRESVFVSGGLEDNHGYELKPKYQIGEIVAIAQSYASIVDELEDPKNFCCMEHWESASGDRAHYCGYLEHPGFTNKMFVSADEMPHQIRITNVRIERLQDISDEDCLKEGIYKDECQTYFNGYAFEIFQTNHREILAKRLYKTPREAYAHLIDKISGKGTFESNPYVFVYDFELVK